MKKTLILIGLGALLLSGCASKSIVLSGEMKTQDKNENSKVFKVGSSNATDGTMMGTRHIRKNINHKLLIEANAKVVLKNGYNYFVIVKPINSSEEMITSAEELHKLCFDKGVGSSFYDSGKTCSFSEKDVSYQNIIVAYKDRPMDVLTISAKEVLEYLRSNDLLVEQKDIDMLKYKEEYLTN